MHRLGGAPKSPPSGDDAVGPRGSGVALDYQDGRIEHRAVKARLRLKPTEVVLRTLDLAADDKAVDRGDIDASCADANAPLAPVDRRMATVLMPKLGLDRDQDLAGAHSSTITFDHGRSSRTDSDIFSKPCSTRAVSNVVLPDWWAYPTNCQHG